MQVHALLSCGRCSDRNTHFIANHIVLSNTKTKNKNPFLRYSQDIKDSIAKISDDPAVQRKCGHKGLTIKLCNKPLQLGPGRRRRTKLQSNGVTDRSPPQYSKEATSTRFQSTSPLVFLRSSSHTAINHRHLSSLPQPRVSSSDPLVAPSRTQE